MSYQGDMPSLDDASVTSNSLIKWALEQPDQHKAQSAEHVFSQTLERAARHKSASGNSCVLLCGFVTQAAKSDSPPLQTWAFSRRVSVTLLTFYLEWNETDQHRAMKLVLDLLILVTAQNPDRGAAALVKTHVLDTLISVISGTTTKPMAKSAIKMFDHLLGKAVLELPDIAAAYGRARGQASSDWTGLGVWKAFMFDLFGWMRLHFVCPPAGHLVVLLYRVLRDAVAQGRIDAAFSPAEWHEWIVEVVSADRALLPGVQNYVFMHLFKNHRPEGLEYLQCLVSSATFADRSAGVLDTPALLELAILKVAKKVGLVEEPGVGGDVKDARSIPMDPSILDRVISHTAPEIRSLALSLLVTSASPTKPFSSKSFDLMRQHLSAYFADLDAKFRNDVVGLTKDMYQRLRASMYALQKSIAKPVKKAQQDDAVRESLERTLDEHRDFLVWYLSFLRAELVPTASYQRHVTSLKALVHMVKMETSPDRPWGNQDDTLFFDSFDQAWSRALLDLLMDPFDDVRYFSSQALDAIFSDRRFGNFLPDGGDEEEACPAPTLRDFLGRAEDLATRTARADHADGVARTSELLYRHSPSSRQRISLLTNLVIDLDRRLLLAEKDLGQAVLEAPVHGTFAALGQIWQSMLGEDYTAEETLQLAALCDAIVSCCQRTWLCVKDVLCDDSPEGHLPQDLEEMDGLGTKELLSYSFRATHDSSNLMKVIVLAGKADQRQKPGMRPSLGNLRSIGDLSFEQLSTLRHRGALGTVSLTFAACCQLVSTIEGPCNGGDEQTLLDGWYKGALDCIRNQVSVTRRSAGIPAIIIGILSANAVRPSFEQVMDELMKISQMQARISAKDETSLPQVHAHNCLREIFKSSVLTLLGNKSEKYLPTCLELAANSLKSEVWAIRNCGLLLLRSLIDCLFGTGETKASNEAGWDGKATRIHYHRYATLPGVLVGLLKGGQGSILPGLQNTRGAESVFPALDIIRRAGPPDALREELQGYIATYLASPVWHLREMAARTLCSCLLHDGWLDVMEATMNDALVGAGGKVDQNRLHGAYLALKFVFEKMVAVMPSECTGEKLHRLQALLRSVTQTWPAAFTNCPEILAAHIEVINTITFLELTHHLSDPDPIDLPTTLLAKVNATTLVTVKKTSPLLRTQLGKLLVYEAARARSVDTLGQIIIDTAAVDANAASAMLETIAVVCRIVENASARPAGLCDLYVGVCLGTKTSEPRVVALDKLADLLSELMPLAKPETLPQAESVRNLWIQLAQGPLSPSVSDAIIRASGTLLGFLATTSNPVPSASTSLAAWGTMMAAAGTDDKGFDTRLAAVSSLGNLLSIISADWPLTALLAAYDALNDDDDEIRAAAALAVAPVVESTLEPVEAAARLLTWLPARFSHDAQFHDIVLERLVGPHHHKDYSVATRLSRAFGTGDVLFVVEEQNLFVDEVREAKRWAQVLAALPDGGDGNGDGDDRATPRRSKGLQSSVQLTGQVREWCKDGVDELLRLAVEKGEDGPLGWTARPDVFAVAASVLIAASALVRTGRGDDALEEALDRLKSVGREIRLSGLLLELI